MCEGWEGRAGEGRGGVDGKEGVGLMDGWAGVMGWDGMEWTSKEV